MNKPSEHNQALLIELGCEELPARQIEAQLSLLAKGLRERLQEAGLLAAEAVVRQLGTPRRLAVIFEEVSAAQPDRLLERKGPAESVAFDADGRATRAAEGFARSVGVAVEDLERLENEQGRWLLARVHQQGQALAELLPDMLDATVRTMAGARSMRWSDRSDRFLRPVRWLVVLHGDEVVPVSAFGLAAGRHTMGHRIHAPGPRPVASVAAYPEVLLQAFVEVDSARRRDRIWTETMRLAEQAGLQVTVDEALLDEVAGLTEWPVPVLGRFDEAFLEVPSEALVSSMQQHQKCFPLRQANGRLAASFVAVANLESANVDAMRAGFERVIRPRLADARFFFEQDRRQPLADRLARLAEIKFQEKLGSVADKVQRLQDLGRACVDLFGADSDTVVRAARLCKCDLVTEMVGEFPELQGVMGRHYALADGESERVAEAVESHYLPRYSGDDLPDDPAGQTLALVDRLDTLVGGFAAGQKPKGGKDPFALRRAALGVVRLLEVAPAAVPVRELLKRVAQCLLASSDQALIADQELIDELDEFIAERLRSYALDQGMETNTVHAVAAVGGRSVADFLACARAVQSLAEDPRAAGLIASNKRIANLLRQAGAEGEQSLDRDALIEPAEQQLAAAMDTTEQALDGALAHADYPTALARLTELGEPIDRFFDAIMVMADDQRIRRNRLALLARLRAQFLRVADVARLGR